MNKLRLVVTVALAASPIAGVTLFACSSDSIVPVVGTDAAPDTFVPPVDSGTDAAPDAFDGGFRQEDYDVTIAKAMCNYLSRCCFGTTTPADGGIDGGSFNLQKCLDTYRPIGFSSSNQEITVADASAISIDQVSSAACVDGINALACVPAAAAFRALRTTCFSAVKGKGAAGAACRYSIECGQGLFCKATDPNLPVGNPGVCTALRAVNESCSDTFNDSADRFNVDEEACSTRGSGDTNRFCQYLNGAETLPREQWTCQPAAANGSTCHGDPWCNAGLCAPSATPTCVSSVESFPADYCATFVK